MEMAARTGCGTGGVRMRAPPRRGIFMQADRSCRRGDGRSSAIHAGQMKGEPGRSSIRQEVSSKLGCLRKQAGLSHLPVPPLLTVPAAHPQPRQCPARSCQD